MPYRVKPKTSLSGKSGESQNKNFQKAMLNTLLHAPMLFPLLLPLSKDVYHPFEYMAIIAIPKFFEEKTDIHIVPGSLVPMRPPNQKPYPNPYPHPRHSENPFEILSRNNLRSLWLSSPTSNCGALELLNCYILSTNVITLFDCPLVCCIVIGSKNAQSQSFHCTFSNQLDKKEYRPDC